MDYQAWCPLLWGAPVQRSQYVCGIEGSQWDSRSATEYSVPDWTALIHSKWCSWALAEVGLFIRHTLVQSMLLSSVAHGTVIYLGWDCVHRKGQGMPSRCIHRSSPDSVGLWVRRQSARVSPRNHTPQRVIDVQTLSWQQRIASRTDAGASPRPSCAALVVSVSVHVLRKSVGPMPLLCQQHTGRGESVRASPSVRSATAATASLL